MKCRCCNEIVVLDDGYETIGRCKNKICREYNVCVAVKE